MDDLERELELNDDVPNIERRKKPKLSLVKQLNGEFQTSRLSFLAYYVFFEKLHFVQTLCLFENAKRFCRNVYVFIF